jgi:hypothetical protein
VTTRRDAEVLSGPTYNLPLTSEAPSDLAARANGPRTILTIGNVLLTERKAISEAQLEHELGHVDQWAIFQAALPQLYGVAEGISQTAGRGTCWNVFERWAGFSKEVYPECLA